MSAPTVQLLQGMIQDSETNMRQLQDLVQSLPRDSELGHTLRNLQHFELLRLNALRTVLAKLEESS